MWYQNLTDCRNISNNHEIELERGTMREPFDLTTIIKLV